MDIYEIELAKCFVDTAKNELKEIIYLLHDSHDTKKFSVYYLKLLITTLEYKMKEQKKLNEQNKDIKETK